MTTIYECAFCDNKTTKLSDWGIDFENDYGDRFCCDCFHENYGVCEVCDENCLKEEMVEATDEDDYEYSCCPDCEPSQQYRQNEKAELEKVRERNNAGLMAMKIDAERKAATYNPLEGLNARQIQRIFRLRAEREAKKIANCKYEAKVEVPAVTGTCGDCAKWFDEGKDFCKCCGFDLNSYNQSEEDEE